ncbi:MAG: molybdopterin-dependent oxidoreductase [Rhodobacteraceae bacterium]|nr:molybdopterin-dependent oxidoreductase [Paracoccaceae bacterium]
MSNQNEYYSGVDLGFTLNNSEVFVTNVQPAERLSESLRERLLVRDVKVGCNAGDCGACSVIIDGEIVCACLTPTLQVEGKSILTAQGIVNDTQLGQRLAGSFQKHGASQCGICTPGMMVSAYRLLETEKEPTEKMVRDYLGGVLCRCTGYQKIIDGVLGVNGTDPETRTQLSGFPTIGESVRHLDGKDKVTGLMKYGDDVAPPYTLMVKVIRSPYNRAAFHFGDLDGFVEDNPEVEAILTHGDIPGVNYFGIFPGFIDQPVFADDEARFKGEAVAAIVGFPEFINSFAVEDFPITWTELPSVLDIEDAEEEGIHQVLPGRDRNVLCRGLVKRGDYQKGLQNSEFVAEGEFTTSFVEHAYIEPEAGYSFMDGEQLVIQACTQSTFMDKESLQEILNLDQSKIRVVPTAVGGAFGAKLDLSVQPYLALATLKTGQPARIAYTRQESFLSTTKRHPAELSIKVGVNDEGLIQGIHFRGKFNTGAFSSWGPAVINRVPIHATGPYYVPNYLAETKAILTNSTPSGAFRGFGVPQATAALEALLDDLALKIGIDPLEFRIKNALDDGLPNGCGQIFESGVGIKPCLEALRPYWAEEKKRVREFNDAHKNHHLVRGVGVASGWYGCGNTALSNPSTIKAGIKSDGTVFLHQGAIDIGQGSNTVIPQIFGEALGMEKAQFEMIYADTDLTPDAGKTSGSRQTFVSGNAARLCGMALKRQITRQLNVSEDSILKIEGTIVSAGEEPNEPTLDLATLSSDDDGFVFKAMETYDPPTITLDENGQGEPYAQYGYTAHLAVVEVDRKLGKVGVVRIVAAHDVGKAINPMLIEGQVHGGVVQGLGMTLMEEFIPGKTDNLHDYLIPTIGDIPEIKTIIVEVPDPCGPFGAKGLGEHALIPTPPAILNGIFDATGVQIRKLPASPDRVLKALTDSENDL